MPAATVTRIEDIAAATPGIMPEFVCTKYPQLRVTLSQLPLGRDERKVKHFQMIQFAPRRIGTDERTNNPLFHGFYRPRDQEELDALRYECARGYCPATEVNVREREAYAVLDELRTSQNNMVNARPQGR